MTVPLPPKLAQKLADANLLDEVSQHFEKVNEAHRVSLKGLEGDFQEMCHIAAQALQAAHNLREQQLARVSDWSKNLFKG